MSAGALTDDTITRPFYATGRRSRDLAREMGLSEAELLAAHRGPEVVRLRGSARDWIEAFEPLGEIMALTRNEAAVHEKVGTFGNVRVSGTVGLVLNDAIDLRLFLGQWASAFALEIPDEAGPRRSLQVFDAAGDAIIKVHLRPGSNVAAFEAVRSRLADPAPNSLAVNPYPPAGPVRPFDAEGFRAAFAALQDVHAFHPLLARFDADRYTALLSLPEDSVRRLNAATAPPALLEAAAAGGLPIMVFVGNRGCIQIHHGAVRTIKVMGPWLNVLDPGFNLHLRADLVADALAVRKPARHGLVTSVELYGADRSLIAQMFGVRDEDAPEDERWRALVASL